MERTSYPPLTGPWGSVLRHPLATVLLAATASLALGFAPMPFWDEDEPRFAAIARTMLETGDWIVPIYNDTLAVDKPVLMHWCMAVCYRLFGVSEIPARLPAALATVATGLALLHAGTRWFSPAAGVVAALAWVGCLLVGIEAHAATPDAILTALTTWITVLAAEPLVAALNRSPASPLPPLSVGRAAGIGALAGLAVLCKGPVGFVGPLAVVLPWATWLAWQVRRDPATSFGRQAIAGLRAACDATACVRPVVFGLAMLAVDAPWYIAVGVRTGGEWPAGFFFIHNIGRFAAPMENHSGGILFHGLAMLVGFYPWSCFLPAAIGVAAWRVAGTGTAPEQRRSLGLVLFWMLVWVGTFSLAATKLPNYVLPAYPAAALLMGALAAELIGRDRLTHPRLLAAGLGWVAFGGIATIATVLIAGQYGLAAAGPAALVGLVPVIGAAACWWGARSGRLDPVMALVVTGLVYSSLAVGPAAARISVANALPPLIAQAHRHAGGRARLATYGQNTPNVVYYAHGHVTEWKPGESAKAVEQLASGDDVVLLVTEEGYADIEASLPAGTGIVGSSRPLFKDGDFLLVGTVAQPSPRQAAAGSTKR